MDKILLILAAIAIINSSSLAQDKVSEYLSDNKNYDIQASYDKKNELTLWIAAPTTDTFDKVGIYLEEKNYDDFAMAMVTAKQKYQEWSATAKKNNITDLVKDIPIQTSPRVKGYFLYGKDWKFDYSVKLRFVFQVFENKGGSINYNLFVLSGELTASDNEFIDNDGAFILLSSEEEIDDFMAAMNLNEAKATLKKMNNQEDLFH